MPFNSSEESKKLISAYKEQFARSETKISDVTQLSNGNMTSYILKKSVNDIGEFNKECLIALEMKQEAGKCKYTNISTISFRPFYEPAQGSFKTLGEAKIIEKVSLSLLLM